MFSPSTKAKIQRVVSVFETGRPEGDYAAIALLNDGPVDPATGKRRKQVTYGKHQTTEFGNLKALLTTYCADGKYGKAAKELRPYLSKIGVQPLADNLQFINLLKIAGTCEEMHIAQDGFFDQFYWNPALNFFRTGGFSLPLSMLVIYDSYIHSGGIPDFLRKRFAELLPAAQLQAKGNKMTAVQAEQAWVAAYVDVRDSWLENHSEKILRNTDYRTDCFKELLKAGDWQLQGPVVCKFNQADPKNWVTVK